jgi:hypothetical protein
MARVGSDLTDLQSQVLARRAELLRAWNYQVAQSTPPGTIASDWNDLSSRAWDFGHESQAWLTSASQDERGRALLRELYAMYQRFQTEKIGPSAMPTAPPPIPPSPNPANKAGDLPTLFGGIEQAIILGILLLVVLEHERR